MFYFQRVPFKGEQSLILDSAIAHGERDSLLFTIPVQEERVYQISALEVGMNIYFINDSKKIDVYGNYGNPNLYSFQHSPASTSLKDFTEKQNALSEKGRKIAASMDSIKLSKGAASKLSLLQKEFDNNLTYFFKAYKDFEDTVQSAGAFLAIYNNIDFGKDYAGLKQFIIKAADRFPHHTIIQQLKKETLDYVKIFEEEYNIGDSLPSIELPNQNDIPYSTSTLKGKYYLIDFWSTWCPQCIVSIDQKVKVKQKFPGNDFEIVSVAIDAEKNEWKRIIGQKNLNWPQLIDEKMWEGVTVKTLKFDSIPFNFLVSPQGRVLAKAIKPDSLVEILSKYLKPKK